MNSIESFDDIRVLVVSPIDGGSLAISQHAAAGFEELGVPTKLVDLSWMTGPSRERSQLPSIRAAAVSHASELILDAANEFRPDLCFMLAQAPVSQPLVQRLRELGIFTAYWFVENYRLTRYWKWLAPTFDWFFTVQDGDFHEKLRALGCTRIAWLPLACNPVRHHAQPNTVEDDGESAYAADVSFAGFGYYNRRRLLAGLSDYDFKLWGPGFESSTLASRVQNNHTTYDEQEWLRIVAGGRVHVNLHSASHVAGVDPTGDYLNPRTFELAACGAFQLVDARSDLRRMFRASELPSFRDLRELRSMIDYYLEHPAQRRVAGEQAKHRVLSEHTYRQRMLSVLSLMAPRIREKKVGASSRHSGSLSHRVDVLADSPEMTNEEILLRLATGRRLHQSSRLRGSHP